MSPDARGGGPKHADIRWLRKARNDGDAPLAYFSDASFEPMRNWAFLTSHARVLLAVARDPELRVGEIAEAAGIAGRSAYRILADLVEGRYLRRTRVGRRNRYELDRDLPLGEPIIGELTLNDLLSLEEAEREFVSNAAHELRNPLAGISGAIEVLRAGAKDDPEAREHFLKRLSDDVERMGRLTEALLTLARVESLGPGAPEVVDVALAAEDAALAVELPEGIELTLDIEAELCAKGHPTLLRQVLIGLVTNAYKNTPAPGAVSLRARQIDDEVILEVTDNGSGIPAAEVERVFERFYRRSASRSQDGFGLGLAIARRMVDVMGGQLGATSQEGAGSTFWVRLPVEPARTPVA